MALIVNGQFIGDDILQTELMHLCGGNLASASTGPKLDALLQVAEQNVVERVLLWQMACESNLQVTSEEISAERRKRWGSSTNSICGQGVTSSLHTDLLIEKMRRSLTRHVPRPTRAEQEQAYQASGDKYFLPEQVLAAHIIRNCECQREEAAAFEVLRKAEEELNAGRAFAKVARLYSDCEGDGQIGWIARGEMVQEFEDVVFALNKGERSPIFQTIFGFHIAMTINRKAAHQRSFEEVRPEISLALFDERKQSAVRQAVAGVARRSQIQRVDQASQPSPSNTGDPR